MFPLLFAATAFAGARPITPNYEGNCQSPSWATDGGKLAYEVNYHDRKVIELYVYEPGKGKPRQIMPLARGSSSLTAGFATSEGENVAHEVAWAPKFVDRLVYSASSSAKDYDLYIDQAGPIAKAPGTDGGPSWAPNGQWIVFSSARTGQGDLYLLDMHHVEQPPKRLTTDADAAELFATFSPDSSSVAYVWNTDICDNIYMIEDIHNPKPRAITAWPHTQTRPSFSPDGDRLAYYSNHENKERVDIYVTDFTSDPVRIVKDVIMNATGPAWTPDGKHIVTVKNDEDKFNPVWMIPTDGKGRTTPVATRTVGNGDLDVTLGTDGRTWLAIAAQGLVHDEVRDFKRIYVMELPTP